MGTIPTGGRPRAISIGTTATAAASPIKGAAAAPSSVVEGGGVALASDTIVTLSAHLCLQQEAGFGGHEGWAAALRRGCALG